MPRERKYPVETTATRERERQRFKKRKFGLARKAKAMSEVCNSDVAVLIQNRHSGKKYFFASRNIRSVMADFMHPDALAHDLSDKMVKGKGHQGKPLPPASPPKVAMPPPPPSPLPAVWSAIPGLSLAPTADTRTPVAKVEKPVANDDQEAVYPSTTAAGIASSARQTLSTPTRQAKIRAQSFLAEMLKEADDKSDSSISSGDDDMYDPSSSSSSDKACKKVQTKPARRVSHAPHSQAAPPPPPPPTYSGHQSVRHPIQWIPPSLPPPTAAPQGVQTFCPYLQQVPHGYADQQQQQQYCWHRVQTTHVHHHYNHPQQPQEQVPAWLLLPPLPPPPSVFDNLSAVLPVEPVRSVSNPDATFRN